jgi:hypothetical protein
MQTLTHISNTSIETAAVRGGTAGLLGVDTLWELGGSTDMAAASSLALRPTALLTVR